MATPNYNQQTKNIQDGKIKAPPPKVPPKAAAKAPVYNQQTKNIQDGKVKAPVVAPPANIKKPQSYVGQGVYVPAPSKLVRTPSQGVYVPQPLVRTSGGGGGGTSGGKLASLAYSNPNYPAAGVATGVTPPKNPVIRDPDNPNYFGYNPVIGNSGPIDPKYTTPPPGAPPKAFDFVNATTLQLYNYMMSLSGVKGKEKEYGIAYEHYYKRREYEEYQQSLGLGQGQGQGANDWANSEAGVTAANAATLAQINATGGFQNQQQAALMANNLAVAQLQYANQGRDDSEYNQMVEMYQALQQQMMTLQNTYIQSLIDRDKTPAVPAVPAPVPGPTPFTPPSWAPSAQTGAYAEFNDVGLGALNTMNPANLQALRQLMQARGYIGTGATGRYGERTYARGGGSGPLGITDAEFENPLNYYGIDPRERENTEAALRWFLGQSGYSPQFAFPGMPTYPPSNFMPMPPITIQ